MRLIMMRHGETAWTRSGQHTGISEIPLTARGRADAAEQAPVLRQILGDELGSLRVFVSPRERARATAQLAWGGETEECDVLREFGYGDYEGLTPDEIQAIHPGWNIWADGARGGESMAEAAARADEFLELCRDVGTALAFTHGHMSRVLAARALGFEARFGGVLASTPGSISVINVHRGRPVLELWNLGPPRRE